MKAKGDDNLSLSNDPKLLTNLIIVGFTYVYVFSMIIVSDKAPKYFNWSRKTSRKILHLSIGILPFILPFFSHRAFPLIVALPFIPITFLACPYSPFQNLKNKLSMLQDKTEIGHPLGLVFYSTSYTILTALFFHRPYIVAAGVLPMAYGDSSGALVGVRYGKTKYKIFTEKSVEGSLTVFGLSFLTVMISLLFYSTLFQFSVVKILTSSLLVAFTAMGVEAVSPKGADNLFLPLACATVMYLIQTR